MFSAYNIEKSNEIGEMIHELYQKLNKFKTLTFSSFKQNLNVSKNSLIGNVIVIEVYKLLQCIHCRKIKSLKL